MITYTVKVNKNGTKFWYLNGKRHRDDGPAIEWADGAKFWYLNGKRHREDGPAVEYADGRKWWFLNDEHLTEAEYNKRNKKPERLTVSEVCKRLGYDVEIVKDDE